MNSDALWPLAVYSAAVLLIVAGMLGLPLLLGERHWRKTRSRKERGIYEPYESGIRPTGTAQIRLPIQYYLVAMFFVIFDLEAVFIYAWAVAVPETGWLGFWEISIFIIILLAALVYLWRIGALDWGAHYRRVDVGKEKKRDALVA